VHDELLYTVLPEIIRRKTSGRVIRAGHVVGMGIVLITFR
jgi:hypothetical protein